MKTAIPFVTALLATTLLGASALALPIRPPDTLALPADWYPESVAVAADGTFYVGSWRQGAVARLRPGAKSPEILVPPGSNGLANGQGLLLDSARHLLWVCSGTIGFTTVPMTPSALKSYDLESGAPRGSYVMPDHGYCNDLAQDDGRIYVTDSLHPRILIMSLQAAKLEIWKEAREFGTGATYFLNGIAIDQKHRLYVSTVNAAPYLLRMQIGSHGEPGEVIELAAPRALKNADALRSLSGDRIAVFESNAFGSERYGGAVTIAKVDGDRIVSLKSVVSGLNDPSSGVVSGDRLYFIESKYSLLFAHKGDDAAIPRNVPFDLQSIPVPK